MRKISRSSVTSKKAWKIGQRVTLLGHTNWGTITKVIDRNLQRPNLKFKGVRRWAIYVMWDGAKREEYVLTRYIFREGEGNGFWGIQHE